MSMIQSLMEQERKVCSPIKLVVIKFPQVFALSLVYVECYGCQMNVNDTEIVHSILKKHNYSQTDTLDDAGVVLLMTCAIREGAERKIWERLNQLKGHKLQRRKSTSTPLTVGLIGKE